MNLQKLYHQLYEDAIIKISSDHYDLDPWIHSDHDDRFGLSLVIRPSEAVKKNIEEFLRELSQIEPRQYSYPNSDIHITIISVISCYSGLQKSSIKTSEYVQIIDKYLPNLHNVAIRCEGVTASPSCIMIQGFPINKSINAFRDELRKSFVNSELEQSMDERYLIQTAHATVFRFVKPLQQKEKFLEIVEKYKDHDFGTFEVDSVELVYNDWYHRKASRKTLHKFELK